MTHPLSRPLRVGAAIAAFATIGLAPAAHAQAFALTSPDFAEGSTLPQRFEFKGFGCAGDNQSPALRWSGAPAGTQSFAVTAYDPDAPTGSGWWHWFVVDLPLGLNGLAADAGAEGGAQLPAGARHIRNDYGAYAWGGMCPPAGDKPHRYVFTLHALSVPRLDIPDDASAALAGFMVNAHSLAKASFTVTYGR